MKELRSSRNATNLAGLLKFGVLGSRLVHVDDPNVLIGLPCNCRCPNPACRGRLVAKKRLFTGRVKQTFFAHASGIECSKARESALHLLAKKVLTERKILAVPPVLVFSNGSNPWRRQHRPGERIVFDSTHVEREVSGFRPDITGRTGDTFTFVEVRVSHAVDEKKRDFACKNDWRMVEIDLRSLLESDFSEESVAQALSESARDRQWVSHPDVAAVRKRVQRASRLLPPASRCPFRLGRIPQLKLTAQGTARWEDSIKCAPCPLCPCCVEATPAGVLCTGRSFVDSPEKLARWEAGQPMSEPTFISSARLKLITRLEQRVPKFWQKLDELRNRLKTAKAEWEDEAARRRRASAYEIAWEVPLFDYDGKRAIRSGTGKRKRPLDFKKPVRSEFMELSEEEASMFELSWDARAKIWVYIANSGSVPRSIRGVLDITIPWSPVFPAQKMHYKLARSIKPIAQFKANKESAADEPDRLIEPSCGVCRVCGAATEKVRIGSGVFALKTVIRCSAVVRHPMTIL